MRTGKLTEQTYRRLVHDKQKQIREELLHGAAGDDCAIFSFDGGKSRTALFTCQVAYGGEYSGSYGVFGAVNRCAAAGYETVGVCASLLLPLGAEENLAGAVIQNIRYATDRLQLPLADVNLCVTAAATRPVATVVAVAKGKGMFASISDKTVWAGMDVVMTKWAGMEGSVVLARACKEELLSRYPSCLVTQTEAFDERLSVVAEAAAAGKSGVCMACAAGEGGIFRGLWTLAQQAGVGLEIVLKQIPIRQETVEICNMLDLNPYEIAAGGSLLLLTPSGRELVGLYGRMGIPAAVIGKSTAGRDRVVLHGEERRFLEPSKADALFKITDKKF